MFDLDTLLLANRAAVDDLLATAERIPHDAWTVPRAPGKWSPSQIVEHVARSLEEGGNVVQERPSKLPSLPSFIRPLARLMFNRVIKRGAFFKAKTNKAMNPIEGPATVDAGRIRLIAALGTFERDCRGRKSAGGMLKSPAFGTVSVEEYARFVELHTRHHTKQMPVIL
jgi:hypothetical protein